MNKEKMIQQLKLAIECVENDEPCLIYAWFKDGKIVCYDNQILPMNIIYFLEAEKYKILSGLRIMNAEQIIN
jgi:hypothetical protein